MFSIHAIANKEKFLKSTKEQLLNPDKNEMFDLGCWGAVAFMECLLIENPYSKKYLTKKLRQDVFSSEIDKRKQKMMAKKLKKILDDKDNPWGLTAGKYYESLYHMYKKKDSIIIYCI